ncbi:hypothetical protein CLPUN_19730 [Clostridium puniceum]|uniref:Uncharacterized protein n=1 Tax=Clostridium puniceum TaxID=29367 RepID=A0A1S8TL59_9CLOT|nr:hypothetical protein CLPUN_19730 [Clostridium puniceum]
MNSSDLNKLGALREIYYEGSDEEILSYIARRKMIRTLKRSKHGREKIDISKTNLQNLTLDTEDLEEVILNHGTAM